MPSADTQFKKDRLRQPEWCDLCRQYVPRHRTKYSRTLCMRICVSHIQPLHLLERMVEYGLMSWLNPQDQLDIMLRAERRSLVLLRTVQTVPKAQKATTLHALRTRELEDSRDLPLHNTRVNWLLEYVIATEIAIAKQQSPRMWAKQITKETLQYVVESVRTLYSV